MSKGSQVTPVRIPAALREQIILAIAKSNLRRRDMPRSLSDWIRDACREKLAHLERSRKKPKKDGKQAQHQPAGHPDIAFNDEVENQPKVNQHENIPPMSDLRPEVSDGSKG